MKISTKGRYGLRAMVDLAINSNGDYVPLKNIAERQSISENYLEQMFSVLRKAELVKSVRGSQGGYTLSDNPSKITVGRILRVLEGELSITGGEVEGNGEGKAVEDCIENKVWKTVNNSINNVIDFITLEDIAEEYRRTQFKDSFIYTI